MRRTRSRPTRNFRNEPVQTKCVYGRSNGITMRSLYAIYRKEMGHYFVSPIAYVAVGLFLILAGVFFDSDLSQAIDYADANADAGHAIWRIRNRSTFRAR